jgi:hypothetical protein
MSWILLMCIMHDGQCRDAPTAITVSSQQCYSALKIKGFQGLCIAPNGEIIRSTRGRK